MMPKNNAAGPTVAGSVRAGLKKGWAGYVWLLKIILPVSFVTGLLVHYGLISRLDFLLTPLMNWIGLPSSAALVLVAGVFTGIYGAVAAMSVMPFSMAHLTLMAVFTLISHNLIQESLVQGKSGVNAFVAALFRLGAAFAVTFVCAKIMGVGPDGPAVPVSQTQAAGAADFLAWLTLWGLSTLKLCAQIFFIIMPLMVVLQAARELNLIRWITRPLGPVLAIMGLDKSCGMLWMTGAVFGLAYGAAVIVEETKNTAYDPEALTKLHLSLGVNHAMIEDPALFLPLGIPALWLWVPRLAAAVVVTYLFSAFCLVRRLYAQRAGHQKIRNY